MTVFLLRHARAGRRRSWNGEDDMRPLTDVGRRQSAELAHELADAPVTRIVSSPSVRCRQTVEPLAARLRLPVDLTDALAEGSTLHETLRLVEKVTDETTVLCTHGDVIETVLDHLRETGVSVGRNGRPASKRGATAEKGGAWALEVSEGEVVRASYRPPPRHPSR